MRTSTNPASAGFVLVRRDATQPAHGPTTAPRSQDCGARRGALWGRGHRAPARRLACTRLPPRLDLKLPLPSGGPCRGLSHLARIRPPASRATPDQAPRRELATACPTRTRDSARCVVLPTRRLNLRPARRRSGRPSLFQRFGAGRYTCLLGRRHRLWRRPLAPCSSRVPAFSRVGLAPTIDASLPTAECPVSPQPLIAVRDVEASSLWYQGVLGFTSGHGGSAYEQLVADGRMVMQLHHWDSHQHPHLGDPESQPYGNGVVLWFQTDDFVEALRRIRAHRAQIIEGPNINPNANHREVWLRDLDGYVVVVAGPYGDLGSTEG